MEVLDPIYLLINVLKKIDEMQIKNKSFAETVYYYQNEEWWKC